MTAPLGAENGARVLYLAGWRDYGALLARFETQHSLATLEAPADSGAGADLIYLYDLANYR